MKGKKTGQNSTDSGPGLRGKQGQVLADLTSGNTIRQAAKNAGISHNTIYAWMRNSTFRTALEESRRAAFFGTKDLIRIFSENAAIVLAKTLESPDESQRRQAAVAILDRALRIEERDDLTARIERLEGLLGVKSPVSEIREIAEASEKGKPS